MGNPLLKDFMQTNQILPRRVAVQTFLTDQLDDPRGLGFARQQGLMPTVLPEITFDPVSPETLGRNGVVRI